MMSEKHAELSSQPNPEIGAKNKLEYWKNKLGNSTTLLSLPTDRPRSAHSANLMGTLLTEWPRDLSHQINELAQRLNTSVAFILVASFEILLHRYTQQDDVSLLIINKKTSSEIDESGNLLQGSLNKMFLRTDFSHDPVFTELIKAVHSDLLEAEEKNR